MDHKKVIMDYFPQFLQEIDAILKEQRLPSHVNEWVQRSIKYNASGGKMFRAQMVLRSFLVLEPNPLPTRYYQAIMLGWCVELLQASFLIADDIMDESITRRGHPCWYRCNDVGMTAINDSFILESLIYALLSKQFKNDNVDQLNLYMNLMELFHDVSLKTTLGQLMDLIFSGSKSESKRDVHRFTMDNYLLIIRYKTAFYSFYLPVALAWTLAGNRSLSEISKLILFSLGEHFQIQDDYLDCFGDPDVIGKVGTDIQEGKCTWLFVKALECIQNDNLMLQKLKENYGESDQQKVSIIKCIYRDIKLEEQFIEYSKSSQNTISKMIHQTDNEHGHLSHVFKMICEMVFERNK